MERGQGRPLVLLHGIALQGAIWAEQLRWLGSSYHVICPDLRGHGGSEAGTDGLGLAPCANDVATICRELDLHDAVLVGHSMGGMVLMELARIDAKVLYQRAAGLVFMSTSANQPVPSPLAPVVKALARVGERRVAAGRSMVDLPAEKDLAWLLPRLAFGARPSPEALAQVRHCLEQVPDVTVLAGGQDLLRHDGRQALSELDLPALVLVGSRDLLTPVFAARRIAALLPHAELEVLAGAGHQLMQERPQEVAELIERFASSLVGRP